MRIERIEFEAIGPFADAYDIDLTQLGDSSLFLIDGPTGAGKSTILDSITFGIYGDTSGSDTDKSRMRSQYAKSDQESWVRITFSTANGTFRIRRAPAYERPKANGKGFTESKATAQFQRLDGSNKWVTEFEQVADSGAAALEAVGLSKAQFSQTVLLPQGEFDKFLKDDSKDRQIVLTKIFGTERFTKFKEGLKNKASKVESDLNELNSRILQQATPIKSILELSLEDYVYFESLVNDVGSTGDALAYVQQKESDLASRLGQAKLSIDKSTEAHNKALAELQLRKLELSRKDALDSANSDLLVAKEKLERCIKATLEIANQASFRFSDDLDWQSRSNLIAQEMSKLEQLLALERTLEERRIDNQLETERLEQDRTSLQGIQTLIDSVPEKRSKLEESRNIQKPLAEQEQELLAKLGSLVEEKRIIETLAELNNELPSLEFSATNLLSEARLAEETRNKLSLERFANMAGELALNLVSGEPCAVCGSLTHPNPTLLGEGSVTKDQVEQSEIDAKIAADLAQKEHEKVTSLKADIKAKSDTLKTDSTVFEEVFGRVSGDLASAKHAAIEIESIESALTKLSENLESYLTKKGSLDSSIATAQTKLDAAKTQFEADYANILANASPYPSIEAKFTATEQLQGSILAVLAAESLVTSKQGAQIERETDFVKLEVGPDFANSEKAEAAIEQTRPKYEADLSEVSKAESAQENLALAIVDLTKALDDRVRHLGDNGHIRNLSEIVSGKNTYNQPLDTFVLQTMFRQVLEAANLRFQSLLEGRYYFELDEIGGDQRKIQGLGLSVREKGSGKSRSARTLSGGESFCASLCLALGLSDIVRSDSGGLAIDTFFIDEGFGSLDGERLNQVTNMLSRLRSEGRTIGLISHVAEMKDALQEKVDVKPSKSEGPSTLTVNWMEQK